MSEFEVVNASTVATLNATAEQLAVVTALGVSNRAAASQLLTRATAEAAQAQQYLEVRESDQLSTRACVTTALSDIKVWQLHVQHVRKVQGI